MRQSDRLNPHGLMEKLTFSLKRYRNALTSVGIVTAGNSVARIIDLMFGVIVARTLGVEIFGIFTVLNTLLISSATITRFGLNSTFTKIVSDYKREELKEKEQVLTKAYFIGRLSPYIPYVIVGVFLSGFLGDILDIHLEQVSLIRVVFAGLIGVSLFEFVRTRYQANREFLSFTLLGIFQSAGRILTLIILLLGFNLVSLNSAVYIWLVFPFIAGITGLLSQPKDFLKCRHSVGLELRRMLSFSKWIALSAYSLFLFRGMDVFFLSHYVSKRELGIYSASLSIAGIMFFLTNSLNVVLIPYVCRLNADRIWPFCRSAFVYGLPVFSLCVCIALLSSKYVLLLVYGREFVEGANVLNYLLVAFFLGAFLTPFMSLAFRINNSRIIFYVDAIRGVTGLLGFYLLIPSFGINGAAISLLCCYGISCVIGLALIYRSIMGYLRKHPVSYR